jgi:MFS family permease
MENKSKMTKINVFSILLIPIVWFFCNAAVAPTLGAIAQNFTDASDFQIKMVLSITSVSCVAFSIISGKLAKHFDKKNLILIGLLIYGLAGISTSFATNINQILVLRLITGIGVGFVLPLPGAIIAQNFDGERRKRLLGICTATANIANVVTSIVVGIILGFGWKYPFYAFGLSFVLALTTFLGVPKCTPIKEKENKKTNEKKERLSGEIYLLGLFMILAWMVQVTLTSNLALFWTREKIGATELLGIIMSLSATASIGSGFLYLQLNRLLKKYLGFAALVTFALGFGCLSQASTVPSVVISILIEGVGFGIIMPLIFDLTAQKAKYNQQDEASGLVSSCMHLGGFCSPFIQVVYATLGHNSTERYFFLVSAILVGIAAIIILVTTASSKSKKDIDVESIEIYKN